MQTLLGQFRKSVKKSGNYDTRKYLYKENSNDLDHDDWKKLLEVKRILSSDNLYQRRRLGTSDKIISAGK